jgi:hypothetical protein
VIQIQKFAQELVARGDELLDHHTSKPALASQALILFPRLANIGTKTAKSTFWQLEATIL